MPVLKKPRHEKFVVAVARGMTPYMAYIQAGFSPAGAHAGAHRLLNNNDVSVRLSEVRALIADQVMGGVLPRPVYDQNARMTEWQERWDDLRDAIDAMLVERGAELAEEAPGGSTGLIMKQFQSKRGSVPVYRIDRGVCQMIHALLQLGKSASDETGTWTEKLENDRSLRDAARSDEAKCKATPVGSTPPHLGN
jgi:hypothetical protein